MKFLIVLLTTMLQGAVESNTYVSFCEIVQEPARYDQKTVLTSGIYRAGPEFADFIDPACPPNSDRDVGTFPTPIQDRVQQTRGWKRMGEFVDKDKQAFIVIRGTFDAYRRYEGPLPADPRLKQILAEGNARFGHLNFARFRIRIESVEFVARVGRLQ